VKHIHQRHVTLYVMGGKPRQYVGWRPGGADDLDMKQVHRQKLQTVFNVKVTLNPESSVRHGNSGDLRNSGDRQPKSCTG